MAFSLNTRSRRGRYRPLAEINVTPLVDVMLVLLIIFMVTAPLMTAGVPVNLPKVNGQPVNNDTKPLNVSVNAGGRIFLADEEITLQDLVPRLREIAKNNTEQSIRVRGDKDTTYGRVAEVIGAIKEGGFTKAVLVTEVPGGPPPAAKPAARDARPKPG
jgi:biopolymer transport protein TolR